MFFNKYFVLKNFLKFVEVRVECGYRERERELIFFKFLLCVGFFICMFLFDVYSKMESNL